MKVGEEARGGRACWGSEKRVWWRNVGSREVERGSGGDGGSEGRGRAGRDGGVEDAPGQDTDDPSGRPGSVAKIPLWCCHCWPATCLPGLCLAVMGAAEAARLLRPPGWHCLALPAFPKAPGPAVPGAVASPGRAGGSGWRERVPGPGGVRAGAGGPGHGGPRLPGVPALGGAPATEGGPRAQLEALLAPTRTAITRVYLSK